MGSLFSQLQVARAAWSVACVFPPSSVSPFFYFAVDRRMGDAMQLLQSQGLQEPYRLGESLPRGDCSISAASASAASRSQSHCWEGREAADRRSHQSLEDTVSRSMETAGTRRQEEERSECKGEGDAPRGTQSTAAALAVALHPFAAKEVRRVSR